jgi:hypothetical protein
LFWVGVVIQAFRHFFPIFGEDDSVYDDVFHCVFSFDGMSEDVEGSESSSSLVESFCDEVCGECGLLQPSFVRRGRGGFVCV